MFQTRLRPCVRYGSTAKRNRCELLKDRDDRRFGEPAIWRYISAASPAGLRLGGAAYDAIRYTARSVAADRSTSRKPPSHNFRSLSATTLSGLPVASTRGRMGVPGFLPI